MVVLAAGDPRPPVFIAQSSSIKEDFMRRSTKLGFAMLTFALLLPISALAQIGPIGVDPVAEYGLSISGGPSVIGSDGTLYQATSSLSFTLKSIFGTTYTSSGKLQAFKVTTSSTTADATLKFTGYASLLAIGDNKLYLVVGKTLYIIQLPLSDGTLEGALEDIAVDITDGPMAAPMADPVKVTLKGYAISLKVSPDKKYVYVGQSETTTEKGSNGKTTWKVKLSTLILDADGKKIKEVTLD
jgi:hypothetical protein